MVSGGGTEARREGRPQEAMSKRVDVRNTNLDGTTAFCCEHAKWSQLPLSLKAKSERRRSLKNNVSTLNRRDGSIRLSPSRSLWTYESPSMFVDPMHIVQWRGRAPF